MRPNRSLAFAPSAEQGYRLHKLEVLNWGTFHERVFTVRPKGKSSLLIGQNGSGKSTLVDALLTLLVRPGVRNFNVAAGAKKRERDERSYVRGAYDRGSDESGQGSQAKYLRPKGDHYSVILAWFHNADLQESFTVAQLLYVAADQSVEKIYCIADGERSIQGDFANLGTSDGLLKLLRQRGFRATRTFQEYEGWFQKLTGVKPKGMEVFNQTVAVKDIQRLNDFIRDHMLERPEGDEGVGRLLGHFAELSEAHDSLVKVRQQRDLLVPVAKVGAKYTRQAALLQQAEGKMAAADAYFAQKMIELVEPLLEDRRRETEQLLERKGELDRDRTNVREEVRHLQNEIEQAGGDRLKEIPHLIRSLEASASVARTARMRVEEALQLVGVKEPVDSDGAFAALRARLPELRCAAEAELVEVNAARNQQIVQWDQQRRELAQLRQELESLSQRRENLPAWCVALREGLCRELHLKAKDLPFAAELIQVAPDHRVWEGSIEKVLRGFALSLLVPDRYYHAVTRYVDSQRLTHAGRGQRLVYLRVSQPAKRDEGPIPGAKSLLAKLEFRQGHPLLPWVKAHIQDRFDYQCCETVDEFQQARGLALTPQRHVKSRDRHEKDDRESAIDPRNFVLGWDNRAKRQRMAGEIVRLERLDAELTATLHEHDQQLESLRGQLAALAEIDRVKSFTEIDVARYETQIELLQQERREIEAGSDTLKLLKRRLSEATAREQSIEGLRDELVAREREIENEVAQGRRLRDNAKKSLDSLEASGMLENHRRWFADLDAEFSQPGLSPEEMHERQNQFQRTQNHQVIRLRKDLDPLQERLMQAMSKYLRAFPEQEADLRESVEYLDGFLAVKQRIDQDDLPRYEQRFKERLNEKVIAEVGFFRNSLEQERRTIEEKIELLNQSLQKLEYRPGTHIQLEPRATQDAEIREFQAKLRECIESSFDHSAEANEARYLRIRELILRLRDESNRRWRDKVTDVRRWLGFVATVIDRQTGQTMSVYQDSSGQSGGEKAKLAFTILVAAIAYQYDLDPEHPVSDRFHFVVVDEMFSKVDDQHAEYALELFKQFGLQLLIVAPLDAKARVTQPYVGCYLHVVKQQNRSALFEMTAREFEESVVGGDELSYASDFREPF